MQTSVSVHRKHSEPHKEQVCLSFHFRDGKATWHCSSLEPSLNSLMKQRKMPKMTMKSLRSFQLCNSFCPWRMFSRDSSDAIPMLIVKSLKFETRYVDPSNILYLSVCIQQFNTRTCPSAIVNILEQELMFLATQNNKLHFAVILEVSMYLWIKVIDHIKCIEEWIHLLMVLFLNSWRLDIDGPSRGVRGWYHSCDGEDRKSQAVGTSALALCFEGS